MTAIAESPGSAPGQGPLLMSIPSYGFLSLPLSLSLLVLSHRCRRRSNRSNSRSLAPPPSSLPRTTKPSAQALEAELGGMIKPKSLRELA